MGRVPRRRVDGVLLLDKPLGATSNAALQTAKRLLRAEKAGHTGTLDPLATGLLPLVFGEATKFSQLLLDADKRYAARVQLGVRTTTGDAEGEVMAVRPVTVDEEGLGATLGRFRGRIVQVPPMHSALKQGGVPLYELARRGETVERAGRSVDIRALTLIGFDGDVVDLDVVCSKGTYVRTLAEDLGEELGCGAHVAALRRVGIGPFEVAQAVTLDALEALSEAQRDERLLPVDALVLHLPRVELRADEARRFMNGGDVLTGGEVAPGPRRVYADTRFLGLGDVLADGRLRPRRLVATAGRDVAAPSENLGATGEA